jgi:hypothetical protein
MLRNRAIASGMASSGVCNTTLLRRYKRERCDHLPDSIKKTIEKVEIQYKVVEDVKVSQHGRYWIKNTRHQFYFSPNQTKRMKCKQIAASKISK